MFRLFENTLNPIEPPSQSQPPDGLVAFYWHFARQAKGLFIALFVAGFVVAVLDASIPAFMGRVVTLVTTLLEAARYTAKATAAATSRLRKTVAWS